jgi:anti-anti-sigma regulatory factor
MHLIVENGFKDVIFDLSNVTMGDYRENLFMATFRLVHGRGGRMILSSVPARLRDYLQFIGLGMFFEMKDNVAEAIESMRGGRIQRR